MIYHIGWLKWKPLKMKEKTIKYFKDLLEKMEYYNTMAPFPVFDTEYLEEVKQMIMNLEDKKEYNDIPVVACKYCKSLYILTDEIENDICARCGSVNDIVHYKNIEQYLDEK